MAALTATLSRDPRADCAADPDDFPAEHWIHLRTTNPIESTFATVRLRTRVTKGGCMDGLRHAGWAGR
ncbi:MAG: hypothetical protein GEU93_11350 [Propionibacteriales bacterium]|nr:hypothetical protein [Propionibacteriales bacterium]